MSVGKRREGIKMSVRKIIQANFQEIVVGTLIFLTYLPMMAWMWDRWFARDSYYSHGILIPFVSIYLIWLKKDELINIPRSSSRLGFIFLVIGILIHVISSLLRVYFSSGFSLIMVLVGFVLHFYGRAYLRKIWFAIAFLVFMVPIPLYVITEISFQMKIFAAEIAETLLNKMGFAAIREGSAIKMSRTYVIIDDVCSGLRSLISLMALGSVFGYLMKASLPKRLMVFFSAIPIAIITNVARILFLSTVAEVWGARYVRGFVHDLSGFLIFALAFVLLLAVARLLE